MNSANREWRSFRRRWNASRFEKFLVVSVVLHLIIVFSVNVSVRSAAQREKEREKVQLAAIEKKQKQKEQLAEQVQVEIKQVLKEELAEENLRDFFKDLTEEFLTEELLLEYWDELLEELDLELEDLAAFFDELEEFDPIEVEESIQDLKELMLNKLAELIERDQVAEVEDAVVQQAREMAEQLAETYRQELDKRIGQPIGESLKNAILAEESEAQKRLAQAEQQLIEAIEKSAHAAELLQGVRQRFDDHRDALARAVEQEDQKAETTAKSQLRREKKQTDGAASDLARTRTALGAAGKLLSEHLTKVSSDLVSADLAHAEPAQNRAKQAGDAAAVGEVEKAAEHADSSLSNTERTKAAAEAALAAVRMEMAAVAARQLSREVHNQAENAERLAGRQREATESGDQNALSQVQTAVAAAEQQVKQTEQKVAQLGDGLIRDQAAIKSAAGQSADDDAPGEGARRESNESVSQRTDDTDYASRIGSVKQDLSAGQESLAARSPENASQELHSAAGKLEDVARAIRAGQQHGGDANERVTEGLLRKIEQARTGELSSRIGRQFERSYRATALPQILKAATDNVAVRTKGDKSFDEESHGELQKQLEQIFGEETPSRVQAAERIAQAASRPLPASVKGDQSEGETASTGHVGGNNDAAAGADSANHPSSGRPAATPLRVGEIAGNAEQAAQQIANKQMHNVISAGLKQANVRQLGRSDGPPTEVSRQRAALLQRLANYQNQLGAGRKDFMGQTSQTSIAQALRRYRRHKGSARRSFSYGDVDAKTYKQMVEKIKDRGQIVGEIYDLRAAEGEVSAAETENVLRPAMVSVPELPEEKKDEQPVVRTVAQPNFKTHRFSGVPFLTDNAITIDGDLSDWKDVAPLELDPVLKGARQPKVKPVHQTGYVAYCPKGLLVAVAAIDTSGKIENHRPFSDFWHNDCVEIFIDTVNSKCSARGETHTHQFFGYPFGHVSADEEGGGYESVAVFEGKHLDWKRKRYSQEELPSAGKHTDNGWTFEMLIPKVLLRKGEILPGRICGFNLQLDTGSDLYYYWTCAELINPSRHPNTWGDIQLLGSDAKIEIVDEEGEQAVESVLPGQPVRVRITDPDMNLNDLKKDKVSTTLCTLGGDVETLVLEETDRGSGVFLGAVRTKLNIGAEEAGALEVFEGETVTVEYVDQARAYGERGISIQTRFTVSSLGTTLSKK